MENILECMGLTKDYKGIRALDNLTFSVPDRGCIVGLLGPNGSGKTTFIKLLTGLLTPTSGQIRIAGLPVGTETKSVVAYLPDSNFLSDGFTVQEEIQYYKDFFEDFDEEKAKTMIAELGVNPTQKVRALSKGTKEKLGLLLTLARNAKLFILDEPIAGVDPAARDYILKTIVSHKNADATMIICTHLIGDIEPVLDYVLFLQTARSSSRAAPTKSARRGQNDRPAFQGGVQMVNGDNKYWFENEDKEKSEMPAAEVKGEDLFGFGEAPKAQESAAYSAGSVPSAPEEPAPYDPHERHYQSEFSRRGTVPPADLNGEGKIKAVRGRMLNKLLKYDFRALFKFLIPCYIVLVALAVLCAICLPIAEHVSIPSQIISAPPRFYGLILHRFMRWAYCAAPRFVFSILPCVFRKICFRARDI
ncbi:MAG: ABC transporter ATP-binding protein [Christensenellaceae bacterium]